MLSELSHRKTNRVRKLNGGCRGLGEAGGGGVSFLDAPTEADGEKRQGGAWTDWHYEEFYWFLSKLNMEFRMTQQFYSWKARTQEK